MIQTNTIIVKALKDTTKPKKLYEHSMSYSGNEKWVKEVILSGVIFEDRDCLVDSIIIVLEHGKIMGIQKYCMHEWKKRKMGGMEGWTDRGWLIRTWKMQVSEEVF